MAAALPPLSMSSAAARRRKRTHSSVDILTLSPPYDVKRARVGIQELTTEPSPPVPSLNASLASATTGDSPETQDSLSDDSSDDSQQDSGLSSDSSDGDDAGVDVGYDTDSESGNSTSSSSSSSDESDSGEEHPDRHSPPAHLASPTPFGPRLSTASTSLSSRLSAFLPTLAAANAELERERAAGLLEQRNIEAVDGAHYIEMNLGLGVLEQKRDGDDEDMDLSDSSSSSSASSGEESEGANDAEDESELVVSDGVDGAARVKKKRVRRRTREKNVMGRLMGDRDGEKPDIEVLDG